MGFLLMLFTILGIFAAAIWILYALAARRRTDVARIAKVLLIWAGVYFAILAAVSLTSKERVLGLNEEKHFCGFYFDCHMCASVVKVGTAKTVGKPPAQVTARGNFYIVTVKVASDAVRATLRFNDPAAIVIDQKGRKFARSLEAEAALEQARGVVVPFEQDLGPNHSSAFAKDLVFDLPADVLNPRLLVTKGWWDERLTELFLIGDEDSLFHKKTLFRVEPQSERAEKDNAPAAVVNSRKEF